MRLMPFIAVAIGTIVVVATFRVPEIAMKVTMYGGMIVAMWLIGYCAFSLVQGGAKEPVRK